MLSAEGGAVEYSGSSFRDPFDAADAAPTNGVKTPAAEAEQPRLQGLIWNSALPTAMINGRVVKVGGHWNEYEIVAINKDGVLLRSGEQTTLLKLKGGV